MGNDRLIRWFKDSDTQWGAGDHRGYVGTIDYLGQVLNPYQLTVTPGPTVTAYPTLKNAKNGYRKFLRDKPVLPSSVSSTHILTEDGGILLNEDGSAMDLE